MTFKRLFTLSTLGPILILASCNLPGTSPTPTSTSAQIASDSDSPQPAPAFTSASSQDASPTADSGSAEDSGLKDEAGFGGDVTIPDYTQIEAGESFTKTWRLQNNGESTWTTDYTLVFKEGDQMGGPDSIPLPQEVLPSGFVDISIDLVAPQDTGTYTGFWILHNAAGQSFGVGADGDLPIFIIIRLVAQGTDTGGETPLEDGVTITGASLNATNTNYSGACPVEVDFTGAVTSTGTGALVYSLIPTAETPGFVWDLPGSFTVNYNAAGDHTLEIFFGLTITSSVTGSAFVQVTGGNLLSSNTVSFNITCDD